MQGMCVIEGLVVPAGWDDDKGVVRVALLTNDEGEYLVRDNPIGKQLLGHIHARVRARGWVCGGSDEGVQELQLDSFTTL